LNAPRIPDAAFLSVIEHHTALLHVASNTLAESSDSEVDAAAQLASDNFYQSLGLEHEHDSRAYALAQTLMARMRGSTPEEIRTVELHAAVFGLTLGLMLAGATGWEAPMTSEPR
jgi:hypothetical protein